MQSPIQSWLPCGSSTSPLCYRRMHFVGHGKVTTVTSFRVFAMTCKGVVYGNCGYLDKLSQSVKAMTECRNLRLETISRLAGNWDPRGDSSVAPRDQVAHPISRFA